MPCATRPEGGTAGSGRVPRGRGRAARASSRPRAPSRAGAETHPAASATESASTKCPASTVCGTAASRSVSAFFRRKTSADSAGKPQGPSSTRSRPVTDFAGSRPPHSRSGAALRNAVARWASERRDPVIRHPGSRGAGEPRCIIRRIATNSPQVREKGAEGTGGRGESAAETKAPSRRGGCSWRRTGGPLSAAARPRAPGSRPGRSRWIRGAPSRGRRPPPAPARRS